MKKDTRIIVGICLILLVVAGFIFFQRQSMTSMQLTEFESSEEMISSEHSEEKEVSNDSATQECAVYVSGAVKNPGLYRYYGRARVSDAIEAVGGFTKNAATTAINLAQILNDGEQITVPTKKEVAKSQKSADQMESQNNSSSSVSALVNINTASLDELMTLPGVGQAKANLILDYRMEHGSFSSKEDIMKISGIKEGVYNNIKDLITI